MQGNLDEEVYMTWQFEYCIKGETHVCRLKKFLYGLKQVSHNWFFKLTIIFLDAGLHQSQVDHSLLTLATHTNIFIILIYVDNILTARNDLFQIESLKRILSTRFKTKDIGSLKYFLGLEVVHSYKVIFLNWLKYTLDILFDSGQLRV